MIKLCAKRVGLMLCILVSIYMFLSPVNPADTLLQVTSFGLSEHTLFSSVHASAKPSSLRQTSPLSSPLALVEPDSQPRNIDPASASQQFPISSGRQANQTSLVLIGAVLVGLVVIGTLVINRKE